MTRYSVALHGCDSTRVERELSQEQYDFLISLAEQIAGASTYGCMPVMVVEAVNDPPQ